MRAGIRSRSTTCGTLVIRKVANGRTLNLMTMLVRLADCDWDPIPTDTLSNLVNADYRTIRCVGSPDNEKVEFINPEYLQRWPLERAQACETRPGLMTLRKRRLELVVRRLARILWLLVLPLKKILARLTWIAHVWVGPRKQHRLLALRLATDLHGPNGIWAVH